ncbi:unnamed protein product [Adineta ricciae]|uniref:G-protein coupled receptors family 1 profile domain-containing protein n=1 Tax=Adineta ricciae TaxID=249248 RepID=A0A815SLE1_ADIRI|nr:unnamed protein product [Adineta ricciae]
MSFNISNSTNTSSLMNEIRFILFLTLQIPSIICSLYIFVQYATRSNLRQSIHHHIVLVLLCSSFLFVAIPVSASEAFFFTATVRPASYLFCSIWTWVHYTTNIANLILMSFSCIERHLLIFRLNPLRTRFRRIVYHYIPIVLCLLYPALFYFILIFLYPCEPVYDFSQLLCIMPCYFMNIPIGNFDTFVNNWMPIFAIPLLSLALFARFLLQKRQVHIEIFQWKRDRKMVIQLLSIACLYFFMWAPLKSVSIYNLVWRVKISKQFQIDYMFVLPYFIHLFYPFVILFTNSEFRRKKPLQPNPIAPIHPRGKTWAIQRSNK